MMELIMVLSTILCVHLFLKKTWEHRGIPTYAILFIPLGMMCIVVWKSKLTMLDIACLLLTDIIGCVCIEKDKKE